MLENKLILIGKSSARQIVLADKLKKIGAKSIIKSDDKQILIEACINMLPDVLIIPFFLSNTDAFTFIYEMKATGSPLPLFIIINNYKSKILEKIASQMGVIYIAASDSIFEDLVLKIDNYYRKALYEYNENKITHDGNPDTLDILDIENNLTIENELKIAKNRADISNKTLEEKTSGICDIIQSTGVPTNIKGYYYLRDAVIICIENDDKLLSYTRYLCPRVAEKYDVTPSSIDRSVRHAISIAWRSQSKIVTMFSVRPTGYQYITTIAEKFKMGLI